MSPLRTGLPSQTSEKMPCAHQLEEVVLLNVHSTESDLRCNETQRNPNSALFQEKILLCPKIHIKSEKSTIAEVIWIEKMKLEVYAT